MSGSRGIPQEAFEFYESLQVNNTREWWQAHKGDYDHAVKQPLVALLTELGEEFGDAHLFRAYRDTRFSKDKSPLKEHQGAFVERQDAVGYYLQISAAGLMVAGGWYSPQGKQIVRFRDAVESGHAAHLRQLLATLESQGLEIDGQPLKTRPRGVDPDHPDLDLLRFRALTAARHYDVQPWMGTGKALTRIRADWRRLQPLVEWLADHVGPATDDTSEPPL